MFIADFSVSVFLDYQSFKKIFMLDVPHYQHLYDRLLNLFSKDSTVSVYTNEAEDTNMLVFLLQALLNNKQEVPEWLMNHCKKNIKAL